MNQIRLLSALLALALALAGCGSDDDDKGADTNAASADATDAGAGSDAGTGDASDAGATCAGLPSCLNDKGVEDLSLCPQPANDYSCEAGCCVKKQVCKADSECAAQLGDAVCPNKALLCGCDLDTGACVQVVCATDAACPTGRICVDGGCIDPPADKDLSAFLLRPFWLARPGDSGDAATLLGAQARTAAGKVHPTATFTWKLDGKGFKLDGGKLTATDEAGTATVVATVPGGGASKAAKLTNLGPVAAGMNLRVTVVDEATAQPVEGKVVVIGLADQATPAEAAESQLSNGASTFKDVKWPADIHVIADDHDAVSVLRYAGDTVVDLVIVTRLHHFAKLAFDGKGTALKDKTSLIHGDLATGTITYDGEGEAALGITSVGVGSDLLLFNLDAIIGPSVERPFDDKAPSLVNPDPGVPQDIPGGVTFFLGAPVVTSYLVAAPPGNRVLWSLSGRLGLNELLSQVSAIVSAVDDGLDVGKVVGVLLPYLSGFYSQVVLDVPFGDKSAVPASIQTQDLAPTMPLGLAATIKPSKMPEVAKGQWADLLLVLAGAMLPDGQMIPLGLSAGSDTSTKEETPDGVVDGDPETPGNQDIELTYAPLHGGLRVGASNYISVTAAINVGGGGKKEGGSIIFSSLGAIDAEVSPGEFLPYAAESTWDAKTRTLVVSKVDAAHFYRAVLTGEQATRWQVLMPKAIVGTELVLPDLTTWGANQDIGKAPKRLFVGAFELHKARTFAEVFAPDGLTDLVRLVKRSSFLDLH